MGLDTITLDYWMSIVRDANILLKTDWKDLHALEKMTMEELEIYCEPWNSVTMKLYSLLDYYYGNCKGYEKNYHTDSENLCYTVCPYIEKLSKMFYEVPWEADDFVYKAIHPTYKSCHWKFLQHEKGGAVGPGGTMLRWLREGLNGSTFSADRSVLKTIIKLIKESGLNFFENFSDDNEFKATQQNEATMEINLDQFSKGGSKSLLEDLIARPGGVDYDEKHHGKRQPICLKEMLKRSKYEKLAGHIHRENGKIFIKGIQITKK